MDLSVIIPCHNLEKYIQPLLSSFENQVCSYEVELIFMCDNCTDATYSLLHKWRDAYFEKQSTTDYNGIYREKYIDFEAKSTKSKTSFPLANISRHQIEHLKSVIKFGGIAFFIINFNRYDETYILPAEQLILFLKENKRKSIPYEYFKNKTMRVAQGYIPRLYYLEAVDKLFF